ncbi:hypothetical protein B0T20DRAFT_508904 [Sordaria brevicollis]|uniref:Nephrocystin 3-like N-terminal domain-containing protein n=1 Tax=Sordaria brevicollis TaxID=83679 RepID=A0AAE0PAJ8_SORBR|nr:hypothetical protein B0T20DRAFT_508904 [Sordaria brevicollis]
MTRHRRTRKRSAPEHPPERTNVAVDYTPYRTGHVMGDWRDRYMNVRPESTNRVRMDAFAALQLITKVAYTVQLFDELLPYLVSKMNETTVEFHTFFEHMCEYTLLCHLKMVYEAMPKSSSTQQLHCMITSYSTLLRDAYESLLRTRNPHSDETRPKLQNLHKILKNMLQPSFLRGLCTQQEAAFLSNCSHFDCGYLPHEEIEKAVCDLVVSLRDGKEVSGRLEPSKILGLLPETPRGLLPRIPMLGPRYNDQFWDFRQSYAYRPPIGVLRSHIMNSLKLSGKRGGRYQYIGKPTMKSGALKWILGTNDGGDTELENGRRIFIDWLQAIPGNSSEAATAQANLFWISGNPGAGKSVIMRLIVDTVLHNRTILKPIKNLADRNPIVLYYFYRDQQDPGFNTHRHMLNDLLLQLFEQEPLLIDCIFMHRWYKLLGMSDVDVPLPSYIPKAAWKDSLIPTENSHWSTDDLAEYLIAALTGLDSFRPVYIFLDGPSGFKTQTWEDNNGTYFHFPQFIKNVRQIQPWRKAYYVYKDKEQTVGNSDGILMTNSIKVVVASRPEQDLHDFHLPLQQKSENGLMKTVSAEAPLLRVQDINSNDMKLICRYRFGMLKEGYKTMTPKWRQRRMEETVEEIVREAEGCYQVLQDALDRHPETIFDEYGEEEPTCWSSCFSCYDTKDSKGSFFDQDLELGKGHTIHDDGLDLNQNRDNHPTRDMVLPYLPRTFKLYKSMLSQICWSSQLKESREISAAINLILAHNHSHQFSLIRFKNRPLSLLEFVIAQAKEEFKFRLYPTPDEITALHRNCQLFKNKINKKLYPFVVLKPMEPHHQVFPPKPGKNKTEAELHEYFDLLPFANLSVSPLHPRLVDFLLTTSEGGELLDLDCRCDTIKDFVSNPETTGKSVCPCTRDDRRQWHFQRVKRLLCASLFEHRFLLPSTQEIRPYYKKHVRFVEESWDLAYLADQVEGEEVVRHLSTSTSRNRKGHSTSDGKSIGKAGGMQSSRESWGASVVARKQGWFPKEWVDEFSSPEPRVDIWRRLRGMFTASSSESKEGSELRLMPMPSVVVPVKQQNQQRQRKVDEDDTGYVKAKKVRFEEQLASQEQIKRERKIGEQEKRWKQMEAETLMQDDIASQKKERKMETEILMQDDAGAKKKGEYSAASSTGGSTATSTVTWAESLERDLGAYDDQFNVPVDDGAPPPPYQATTSNSGRTED